MFNLLKPLGPSRAPANQSPNRLPKPKIGFQPSPSPTVPAPSPSPKAPPAQPKPPPPPPSPQPSPQPPAPHPSRPPAPNLRRKAQPPSFSSSQPSPQPQPQPQPKLGPKPPAPALAPAPAPAPATGGSKKKTFRSKRFAQNFRSKLIGTQTLHNPASISFKILVAAVAFRDCIQHESCLAHLDLTHSIPAAHDSSQQPVLKIS